MTTYITLDGMEIDTKKLSGNEQRVYQKVLKFLEKDPEPDQVFKMWGETFPNLWSQQVVRLYGSEAEAIGKPLFLIFQDLECKFGLKWGFIEPEIGYDWLWHELGIADKGKLIFIFYVVLDWMQLLGRDEDFVQQAVYRLNKSRIMPFSYPFKDAFSKDGKGIIPHSDALETDLQDLLAGGYVEKWGPGEVKLWPNEGMNIAEKGKSWVEEKVPKAPIYDWLRNQAWKELSGHGTWEQRFWIPIK